MTTSTLSHEYAPIAEVIATIERYVQHHLRPGHFVEAVLANDLMEACNRADDDNRPHIHLIACYLWNHVRGDCRGSRDAVDAWLARGRIKRHESQAPHES